MGMRVRLKASVDISTFPSDVQVILTALKKYGMILADNGGGFFVSGAPEPRWIGFRSRAHDRDGDPVTGSARLSRTPVDAFLRARS
jgi:hypothetical protein